MIFHEIVLIVGFVGYVIDGNISKNTGSKVVGFSVSFRFLGNVKRMIQTSVNLQVKEK